MEHGRLNRVLAVAANSFRETVRERVLYNLLIFALLMTVSGLILRDLSIRQDDKVIKDLGLACAEIFGTLIAIFIGVGMVSKEIERRSLYPLLAKPLSRAEFLMGKFMGLAFTLLVNIAVMAAGIYLTLGLVALQSYRGAVSFDPALLQSVFTIYLGLLLTVSVALFFSVLTSSTLAAVCTLAVVVVGRYADVVRNMRELLPSTPAFVTQAVYYALPNFGTLDLKNRVVHGQPVSALDLLLITAYAVAYMTVLLGLATIAFRRKDLL
jgi:ABC-type transport system involved in multi-copper enzyme maturation permease subunit